MRTSSAASRWRACQFWRVRSSPARMYASCDWVARIEAVVEATWPALDAVCAVADSACATSDALTPAYAAET